MKNIIKKTLITFSMLPALLLATSTQIPTQTKELALYHTVKGSIEDKFNAMAENKLQSIGFKLTDPHKRVNDQYEAKWGSTVLDVLSFMPVVRDSTILPLLNIDPRIAGFAPFNLVIHKKLDENVTYVGHLVPETMLNILGIENKEVRKKFSAPFHALDSLVTHEIGGYEKTIPYKKLPEKRMINFEYEFEKKEAVDIEDFIDEFQEKFELAFIKKGYLIAGYHNFMEATDNAQEILSDYHAFWTYSLCHLEFSYNMFDTDGARPEAGLFAPCNMYMYIRKGTNKVVIGMARLQNWSDTLDIKDEKRLNLIKKLDTEIPNLLIKLGMKSVPNANPLLTTGVTIPKETPKKVTKTSTIQKATKPALVKKKPTSNQKKSEEPKVIAKKVQPTKTNNKVQTIKIAGAKDISITIPEVPKVTKCASSNNIIETDRSIKFSKRIPPNYRPHSFDRTQKQKVSTHTRIGEVNKGKISAYLRGKEMSVDAVKEKLKEVGFEIIVIAPVNKKEDLISIVFSNKALVSMASKANRGFMASLRVLVDIKDKTISITNPLYIAKGFLQDDFDEKTAKKILAQLIIGFPNLTNSKDTLKYQLLPKYQFMNGMPHYQDMVEVASGSNLLEKIKNNKKVVFSQTLENGSTLIGIKLSKRTRKFTKKIGRNNAAMLPYPILIEDGKARILDPKYYISVMYPKLTMSEFMTIATVPDAMKKDCEKVFR